MAFDKLFNEDTVNEAQDAGSDVPVSDINAASEASTYPSVNMTMPELDIDIPRIDTDALNNALDMEGAYPDFNVDETQAGDSTSALDLVLEQTKYTVPDVKFNMEIPTVEATTLATTGIKTNSEPVNATINTGMGKGFILFGIFMFVFILIICTALNKVSRRKRYAYAGHSYSDDCARINDEKNRMDEESQRQMREFQEQMRQAQDMAEQQRIQEEMLRFQEQMRRDMEDLQRQQDYFQQQHEIFLQQQQNDAMWAQNMANDSFQNQVQQDFSSQQFDSMNNGMF